jgi:hypothetical protein
VRVWPPVHASNQPETALVDWRILQSGRGEHHLVGTVAGTGAGHTSLAICTLDLDAMTAASITGRRYRFIGNPANGDAWVRRWSAWCAAFGERLPSDVTAELLGRQYLVSKSASAP